MISAELIAAVAARTAELGLARKDAARQIGVTASSLDKHLSGQYVRSDSQARYRAWLAGKRADKSKAPRKRTQPVPEALDPLACLELPCPPSSRRHPFNVADVFSGCGGMSLGFNLLYQGTEFRTVLALDNDPQAVSLYNANTAGPYSSCVDVADFLNEAEVLAYYLHHYAQTGQSPSLHDDLGQLPVPLHNFLRHVWHLDQSFAADVLTHRSVPQYGEAYSRLDHDVFSQTSVIGFHKALNLPPPGTPINLGPIVWGGHYPNHTAPVMNPGILPGYAEAWESARPQALALWGDNVTDLLNKSTQSGRGQLASSAQRIRRFAEFVSDEAFGPIRTAWVNWRASRQALRGVAFNAECLRHLRNLYRGSRRADVLLGGPPCQGFSRIGRGKIRSLRGAGVHATGDDDSGDARNQLLHQYLLSVSALQPRVFLFENVRHFKSAVKTHDGTFLATEILHDAIKELTGLDYRVRDRVVDCSKHLMPQARERYVMAGVRCDVAAEGLDPTQAPEWVLALPAREAVPLGVALRGLGDPHAANGHRVSDEPGLTEVTGTCSPVPIGDPEAEYVEWVRQPAPHTLQGRPRFVVDGHVARRARADDAEFFRLLGPGRRWMDYRCDRSETLAQMRKLIAQLQDAALGLCGIDPVLVNSLAVKPDGSLSLRLLLECVTPQDGELHHHLLTDGYLAKREGNNGDWMARPHPDRPCKTVVSHMGKDTYAYVHPSQPRTLSVREAARVQTFPDWYSFAPVGLVDAFHAIGNAVPPLLGHQFAEKVSRLLRCDDARHPTHASS